MKTKALLVVLFVVACIVFVLRERPSTPPTVRDEEPKSVVASAASQASQMAPSPSLTDNQSQPESLPATAPESDSLDRTSELLAAISATLDSSNPEAQDLLTTNLLPALIRADPAAAGRVAEANTNENSREPVLFNVARLWAAQDPTAALNWASGLNHPGERDNALTDVCVQWAEVDPAHAATMRETFLQNYQSFDALEDITAKWAEKDLAGALAWIDQHPKDTRRDQLIGRAAYIQAQTDPADAARMVVEDMTPGDPQIEAAVSVLHQWGKQNLPAATAWAEQFPDGPLRDRALKELQTINANQARSDGS